MIKDGVLLGNGFFSHQNLFREKCEVMKTFDSFRNRRFRGNHKSQTSKFIRASIAAASAPKSEIAVNDLRRELKTAHISHRKSQSRVLTSAFVPKREHINHQ
jgi:hypothetical protein